MNPRILFFVAAALFAIVVPMQADAYSQSYYQPYYQNYYQGYYQASYSTSNSALNFTGDYTIDMWIYPTSVSGSAGILSRDTSSGYSPYLIYRSNGSILFYSTSGGTGWEISNGQTICSSVSVNTWYHIAVVRNGSSFHLYCNGTRTTTFTSALATWKPPFNLVLGRQYTGGAYFDGYIDELRMSNIARWTGSSFTIPSSAYAADANTVLLMHMDDDLSSFYDGTSDGYFAYTPPTGFKALSADNLPAPVTEQPSNLFNVFTYVGDAGTKTIDTTFSPDLVWVKNRAATYWHTISDRVRGINSDLFSNSTSAATPNDSNGWLSAFGATSFSVGGMCNATPPQTNVNGNNYVAFAWKKSQIAGIDVISYTGDGASTRSVSHSLGNTPDLIIYKRSDQASEWYVWSSALTTPAHYLTFTNRAETLANSPFSYDLIPTMTGPTTNGITMSASSEYSGSYLAWRAGDKDTGSYWHSASAAATSSPQWLRVDFGSGVTQNVGAYTIRNYASWAYAPKDFFFQGSNDATSCTAGGAVWTTLDAQEWADWRSYNSGQYRTYVVPTDKRGNYRCYRLLVMRGSSDAHQVLATEFNLWPSTSLPNATTFSVQNNGSNNLNVAGGEYVAYLFANREGFQRTGTYVGNGSSDGPFVYTGFKPKFVMIKVLNAENGSSNWVMYDSVRDTANPAYRTIFPNLSVVENNAGTCTNSSNCNIDFMANGFRLRNGPWETNNSQYTYLYVAFADIPYRSAHTANAYSIGNSLRFDASNNEYLFKTFSSTPTNAKRMTFSFWVKRGEVGNTRSTIISATGNQEMITFENDRLMARFANQEVQSAAFFRDTSKWYHVVVTYDSQQPNDGFPRTRMYVDGREITTFNSAAYPAQNTNSVAWNVQGQVGNIGRDIANDGYRLDGYLADFHFVDGQALAPTWFGAFDGSGYWKPKGYTDVYGNNGFRLNFLDASNPGLDASVRSNNWSARNKTPMDQTIDSPTNGFANLSATHYYSPHYGDGTVRGGGLSVSGSYGPAANWQLLNGKWYWEYVVGGQSGDYPVVGIFSDTSSGWAYRAYPGHDNDNGFGYYSGGSIVNNSLVSRNIVSSFINGDVIGMAYDANSGRVYMSKNGVWQDGMQNRANLIPIMTAATTEGVTMSAAHEYSTQYAWKAGDKLRDTYWYTYSHVPTPATPTWLRVDFGASPKTVRSYSMQGHYGGLGYEPVNFTFEGSSDATTCTGAGAAWTVLDTRSNVVWTRLRQIQHFDVPAGAQASYRCYRVKITGAGGDYGNPAGYAIVEELGLYDTKPGPESGLGAVGVLQDGTPGLASNGGKTYVNFGAGGAPGVTFNDSSSFARTMVEAGSPEATTTVAQFGSSSFYSDNTLAGALRTPYMPGAPLDPAGDFTIDMWVRPVQLGIDVGIFSRDTNSGYSPYLLYQTSANRIVYYSGTNESWNISGGQIICNTIAANTWYHIAVVRSGNTYSLYCNGTRTTTFTAAGTPWRAPFPLVVGRQYNGGSYFRGYIDEVRLSDTARWTGASFTVPTSEYSADANTMLLLHMDADRSVNSSSGAGGYYAYPAPTGYKALSTSNMSAPAATKPTSYFDTKAYSGNAGAPSFDGVSKGSYITLSNSNFDASSGNNGWGNTIVYGTRTFSSGKWYAEFKMLGNYPLSVGIGNGAKQTTSGQHLGYMAGEYVYYPWGNCIYTNNACTGGYPSGAAGDIYMVAVDMDAGKIWFGRNGTWLSNGAAQGNPATGANPQYTGITGEKTFGLSIWASAGPVQAFFGQSGRIGTLYYGAAGGYFNYAPPTGFSALASQSSQDINLVFKPDLVWIKNRTAALAHVVVDAVRGANMNLFPNSTSGQVAQDVQGSIMEFYHPGFTVGASCAATTGTGNVNASGNSYAAWVWDESVAAGLDIISYTGTGGNRTLTHGLGTTPDAVILKRTDAAGDWVSWFRGTNSSEFSRFNSSNGVSTSNNPWATVGSLSFSGFPSYGQGVVGQWALSLTGSQYLYAPTSDFTVSGPFTYSAWVNRNSSTAAQSIFNNNQFFLRLQPNNENANRPLEAFIRLSDSSVEPRVNAGIATTPGTWYHVAVTWDGTSLRMYVNGVLRGTSTRTGTVSASAVTGSIGSGEQTTTATNYFNGRIDDFRFYRGAALSGADITTLYNQGTIATAPTIHYPFEGSYAQSNVTATTVKVEGVNATNNFNASGASYVGYLFTSKEGFSKIGTYIGNGSGDGPTIVTGFKPRYVMIKAVDRDASWRVYDTKRETGQSLVKPLLPNSPAAEAGEGGGVTMLSNGFKLNWSNNVINGDTERYQYMAFAEAPYKTTYDGSSGLNVPYSLRLDRDASSFLSRSVTTLGNAKKHTFSAWVKRSVLSTTQTIYAGNTGASDTDYLSYYFNDSNQIVISGWNTVWRQTYESFTDTSGWYHIVVRVDTDNANPDARIRLWVNNREITTFWCTSNVCNSNPQ